MHRIVYWAKVLLAIAVLSVLVAMLFVWINGRADGVLALLAVVACALPFAWVVERVARKP